MDIEVFKQIGVAVALSSLIGLEREHTYQTRGEDSFGGLRTLTLIGLLGVLSYILSATSMVFFAVLSLGFLGLLAISYRASIKMDSSAGLGGTSEVSSILVFVIGMLSGMGQFLLATTVALITLTVLHFKETLHGWAKGLQDYEIVSTIQFAVIAFIVLPLLPNQGFGPYGVLNPHLIWFMVVLISGLSFLSYIAIKFFGERKGTLATGFLAGFISSTALALSFSGESKRNKNIVNPYVVAILVASSAMFFRILIEVSVVNPDLLTDLVWPILTMGVVGVLCAFYFWRHSDKTPSKMVEEASDLKSPFRLMPAVKFGLAFALVLLVSRFASDAFGDKGVYLASFFSGLTDVDAITVSMASLAGESIENRTAVLAITIAAITNTLVKGGMLLLFGSRKVALRIVLAFLIVIISGLGALMFA